MPWLGVTLQVARAHADALRLEYPEIPLPTSALRFEALVRAGASLASAFLAERGGDHAKIGHHRIEFAPSELAIALAGAESAFREV